MSVNTAIGERLKEYGIPLKDGIPFLLGFQYGYVSSYVPETFERKMAITGIYEADHKSKTIKWNIPLFEEQLTNFEWVKPWMEEFGRINPERKGLFKYVMSRMKKFFAENPDIRKEEVISATNMYFRNVENPKYLKSAHKFIMEGRGNDKYSLLLEWVEKYRAWETAMDNRKGKNNTMQ